MQRRNGLAVTCLVVLAVGGWTGYRRFEESTLSPFKMWDTRAGAPFSAFEAEAAEAHRTFQCEPVEGGVRLCEVETGVAGTMRVALDESSRAMIVQWRVADSSLRMIEEARKMAAQWSLVPSHRSTGEGTNGTRWVSNEGNWSAFMSAFTPSTPPAMISLVDERRLSRTADASATAMLRLAQAGYVGPEAVAAALVRAPGAFAAAARTLGAPGRALALAAAAMPACGFVPGDSIAAGTDMRAALGADDATLLEQAIGLTYPGFRLRIERGAFLVDSSGAAESIRLVPLARNGNAFAFAVSFPRRVESLDRRLLSFGDSIADCRASAHVVVGRRDSTSGQLVDVRRVDVDEEALGSQVVGLQFRDEEESPVLDVRYSATYGTTGWIGVVDWDAVVAPASDSLRVKRRLPNVIGLKDSTGHEIAGIAAVSGTSPAGLDLSVVLPDARRSAWLILPAGPRGPVSGWMLLDLIK